MVAAIGVIRFFHSEIKYFNRLARHSSFFRNADPVKVKRPYGSIFELLSPAVTSYASIGPQCGANSMLRWC